MQKALKLTAISLTLTIICVMFTSCMSVNNTDYPKKYDKFLKYSLGDYKVTDSKTSYYSKTISRDWTIEYHDINGNEKTLHFSNCLIKNNDDNNFGFQIMDRAEGICSNELDKNIADKYFKLTNGDDPYVSFSFEDPATENDDDDNDIKYMNENTGIKLKDITAKSFIQTWNLTLKIYVQTKTSDDIKINPIIEKSKLMLKDLSTYLNINNINCDIMTDDYTDKCNVEYNKNENKFTVTPKEKEKPHNEYPKGHAV